MSVDQPAPQQQASSVIGQSDAIASNLAVVNLLNFLQTSPQNPDNSAVIADIATLLLDGGPASQTTQLLLQQLQQQQRLQQQQQQQQQLLLQLQHQQQTAVQPTTTYFLPGNPQVTLQTSATPVPPVVSDMRITMDKPAASPPVYSNSTSSSNRTHPLTSLQAALLAPTVSVKKKIQTKTSAPVLSRLSTKLSNQKQSREAAANKIDCFAVPMVSNF